MLSRDRLWFPSERPGPRAAAEAWHAASSARWRGAAPQPAPRLARGEVAPKREDLGISQNSTTRGPLVLVFISTYQGSILGTHS